MKKLICSILILVMLFSCCFTSVFAEGFRGPTSSETVAPFSKELEPDKQETGVEIINDESSTNGTWSVKVSNVDTTKYKGIVVPTWSENGSQDDIVWYEAKKDGEILDTYIANIDISKHACDTGIYNMHVYGRNVEGKLEFISNVEIEVPNPTGDLNVNPEQGCEVERTITLSNVYMTGGVSGVQLPTWSQQNDQDDIHWYNAKKTNDGEGNEVWSCNIKVSDFKHLGNFNTHAYIKDKVGKLHKVSEIVWSASIGNDAVVNVDDNKDKEEREISISGLKCPTGIKKVVVPTWSLVNDQDDLVWYETEKKLDENGNATWVAKVKLSKHKHLGTFISHVYIVDFNNEYQKVFETSWKTNIPSASTFKQITETYDENKGTVDLALSEIKNPELVGRVQFPTWQKEDQSDICWYDAKKVTDEKGNISYVATIDVSKHKYHLGTYVTHAYIKDVTGEYRKQKDLKYNFDATCKCIDIGASLDGEKTFPASVVHLIVPGKETGVQVAVWSEEGGQDDLKWYPLEFDNGNYKCSIPTNKLKHDGLCNAHFYVKLKSGDISFLGKETFNVTGAHSQEIFHNNINGSKGTFGVIAVKPTAPSGIKDVKFAVWRDGDQSDLNWYTATKQKDGNYTAVIDVNNHNNHFGEYKIQCFATMGNDMQQLIGEDFVEINPNNYVYATKNSDDNSKYVIRILNANINGEPCKNVVMPTWSIKGGQDDIIWCQATDAGKGEWLIAINSDSFRNDGLFATHVYGNGNVYLGSTTYDISVADSIKLKAKNKLNEIGWNLEASYKWAVNIPLVTLPNNYDARWYADCGLTNGNGNSLAKAAAFVYLAREIGYDARVIKGTAGTNKSQGWAEVNVNGTWYVCDPAYQTQTKRNGYLFKYGQANTLTYSDYEILN